MFSENQVGVIHKIKDNWNGEKYTFCVIKSLEHLKNFKKGPRPLFRRKTNHVCNQKPNPSRETVPLV